jgi:beta-glucanase (GH16 family)
LIADYSSANVLQQNNNLILSVTSASGGTRVSVSNKIQYGTIEAVLKVSAGSNIISSFILMATNGDEIDFEFVGKDPRIIQTNYFYKGELVYNTNARFYSTTQDLTKTYNTFTITWTPEYYEWLRNGVSLRKLFRNTTNKFPDSPSTIQFGIWQAPNSDWAGFGTDWSKSPYNMTISSISVRCFQHDSVTTIPKQPKQPNDQETFVSSGSNKHQLLTLLFGFVLWQICRLN